MLRLAIRNLLRQVRRTALTASAIAVGIALAIVMWNLQNGVFTQMLADAIASQAGHVVVQAPGWQEERETEQLLVDASAVQQRVSDAVPDATVARRVFTGGLLVAPASSVGVALKGVDPDVEAKLDRFDDLVVEGQWLSADDDRGLLVGAPLAERLGVEVGDKVVFMAQPPGADDMVSRLHRVTGIFRTGAASVDGSLALTTVAAAQQVLQADDAVHQLALHLDDPRDTERALAAVRGLPLGEAEVLSWDQAVPDILTFIDMKLFGSHVMSGFLLVIVALGIVNTVLMSTLERTREFGVMLAIGLTPGRLMRLVLLEAALLGTVGGLAGIALGALLSWPLATHGLDYSAFMGDAMEVAGVVTSSRLIAVFDLPTMLLYGLGGVVVSTAAALYPALTLRRLQPVDALRGGR
jgi:ABC-type lipoprotein release transport system permease subunit